MNLSIRKMKTLCKKDIKDFMKNPAMFVSVLIPVLFVVFYKSIGIANMIKHGDGKLFLINIGTMMNMCMGGILIASASIAEEKEKFTLRTLMLSNVNGAEFLISKIIVAFLFTMIGNIFIFFIAGIAISEFSMYFLGTAFGTLVITMISAIIGIATRDQASCSVLQIPVMLLFVLIPNFAYINSFLGAIAKLTPINAAMKIYYLGVEGQLFSAEGAMHLLVLSVWLIFSLALFVLLYKKKGMDN